MKVLLAVPLLPVILAALVSPVGAAPVKCVDEKGKVIYMDEANVGALKCQPVTGSTVVVPAGPSTAPAGAQPDTSLEQSRQRIADAEARLTEAKQRLAEQESLREGNERNYARVLERLKPYQDAVDAAQRDLDQARAQR